MKKILLLSLIFLQTFMFAQTTPSYKNVKLTSVPLGTKNDSVIIWNSTTKLLKHIPVSQIIPSPTPPPTLQSVLLAGSTTDREISFANGDGTSGFRAGSLEMFSPYGDQVYLQSGLLQFSNNSGVLAKIWSSGTGNFYLPYLGERSATFLTDMNIKTVNGQPLIGSGDISTSIPTLGQVLETGNTSIDGSIEFSVSGNGVYKNAASIMSGEFSVKGAHDWHGETMLAKNVLGTTGLTTYRGNFSNSLIMYPTVNANNYFYAPVKFGGSYTLATLDDIPATSSGTYTPSVLSSFNCVSPSGASSTFSRVGNIVTVRITLNVASYTSSGISTSIAVNLPINRTGTNILNIGSGVSYSGSGEYWALVAQTQTDNNSVVVYFNPTSTGGGNQVFTIQYDASL